MKPLMKFSTINPTGDAPGMEPVRLDVLKAAVNNELPQPVQPPAPLSVTSQPVVLINKNIRLPADLVDFIDYTYTKNKRIKKQDAYTEALEAYFRPMMSKSPVID